MKCSKCPADVPNTQATIMCPECHAKEVSRVHQHDTPDVPDVPVRKYQPMPHLIGRGRAERVVRKRLPREYTCIHNQGPDDYCGICDRND